MHHVTLKWFVEHDSEFPALPHPSPDLNPIEDLWDVQLTNLQKPLDIVLNPCRQELRQKTIEPCTSCNKLSSQLE